MLLLIAPLGLLIILGFVYDDCEVTVLSATFEGRTVRIVQSAACGGLIRVLETTYVDYDNGRDPTARTIISVDDGWWHASDCAILKVPRSDLAMVWYKGDIEAVINLTSGALVRD